MGGSLGEGMENQIEKENPPKEKEAGRQETEEQFGV